MSRHMALALVLAAVSLVAALIGGGQVARAEQVDCTGTLGSITVDNLRVPPNFTCTLNGTRVEGNITLEANSTLHAYAVHVDGSIQTVAAATQVNVYAGSFVGGSVQIVQSGGATVQGVDIDGDLQFEENSAPLVADKNTVGGNLQVNQNTGGVTITDNTIDGNLQCQANVPAPSGSGNVVKGSAEDQCAPLVGTPAPTATSTAPASGTPTVQATATTAVPTPTPTIVPGTPIPGDYNCTGPVGAITVENVRVPDNATCILTGTRVEGNVYLERGATLHAYRVRVDGNIQTVEPAAQVNVYPGSFVGGNIQIVQSGSSGVHGVDIDGDLQFDANRSVLAAGRNTIGGNLQAFQNTGGVFITGNTIDGNLQCKQNVPAPLGGGNTVLGSAEDQCAVLAGAHMVYMPRLLRPAVGP